MQVMVGEMMIYWCDLYKKSLLHFLGIGVLQVRRPEGVRRNALRAQRPKSPHCPVLKKVYTYNNTNVSKIKIKYYV